MDKPIDIKKLERELREIQNSRKGFRLNFNFNKKILLTIITAIIIIVGIILLILIIGALINSLNTPSEEGECTTASCFLEKANACEPAFYIKNIETITLRFSITEDCVLTKKVIEIDADEPESIQNAFKNAEMTCSYKKANFNEKYIDQISYDVLTCKGSLTDAIKAIL